jgi:WD40 repeat protein
LKGQLGAVTALAFSPDGLTLASADKTSTEVSVRQWDLARKTERIPRWDKRAAGACNSLAFSPDGKWLAFNYSGLLHWFDVATGPTGPRGPPPEGRDTALWGAGDAMAFAFSADGTLAASHSSGEGGIYRMDNFPKKGLKDLKNLGRFPAVAYSPDGKTLACCQKGWTELRNPETGELLPDGRLLQPERAAPRPSGKSAPPLVIAVAFARDGNALATLDNEGVVVVWDPRTRSRVWQQQLEGKQPCVPGCLSFASSRGLVVARDGTVYVLVPERATDKTSK